MLHREYLPFVPLRCPKPQGPLDPPLFPPQQYQTPPDFWEESAKELFRSVRNLNDLVQTCHEWNALPETPMVGFAIYMVAFIGVYAINFSWMDTEGFMSKREINSQEGDASGVVARQALSLIGKMRRRLRMADGWFRTISRVHKYFVKIKRDFRRNARVLAESPLGEQLNPLSLREGGYGGGLEDFKLIEKTLKEFGSLSDDDMEMTDAPDVGEGSAASTAMKSEHYAQQERTPESGPTRRDGWSAINNLPTPIQTTEPATNGTNSAYYAAPMTASGDTSPSSVSHVPPGQHRFPATSTATTPIISPTQYGHNYPPHPPLQPAAPAQHTSMVLQHQIQPPPPPPPPMTAVQTETWLQSLETRFGGDDVTAFVEGKNWQDWAYGSAGPLAVGGWLSTVWASPASSG